MGARSTQDSRGARMDSVIRQGTWNDFDAAYAIVSGPETKPEHLRSRWEVPSFEPERHLWLAQEDGGVVAFGALYKPDTAFARGDAARIPELLEHIEARGREEQIARLHFVIPEWDEPAWRAYEAAGFTLSTEVLQMEVVLGSAPDPPRFPDRVMVRTYTDDDARAVKELLDAAYTSWDDTYVPMELDDWVAWMTSEGFDPTCWWLAGSEGKLGGVCLTWKEGWVKDIAVTDAWRGKGLGKALLLHALGEHHRRGTPLVGLKVDSINPTGAIQLYERVGFKVAKRLRVYVKQL
jgi:ribosomal protein S18 acetylase RimI-like enzyme